MDYVVPRDPNARRAAYYDEGVIRSRRATFCADFAVRECFITRTAANRYKISFETRILPKHRRILVDASGCRYVTIGETIPFEISIGSVSSSMVCEVVARMNMGDRQRCRRPWEIILGSEFVQSARRELGDDFRDQGMVIQ